MSSLTTIVTGDIIPILLFLQGKEETLYPQAVIRRADGVVVDTVDLDHQVGGLYVNSGADIAMPVTEFVTVQFTVYTDVNRTVESLRYNSTIDTFAALHVNIKYQNDHLLYGTGTPGDPWRGYP